MVPAVLDLILLCAAVVACRGARMRMLAGWALAVLSAAWLPLNNGHLEGPVLLSLGPDHGVTASDLIAGAGLVLSMATVSRETRGAFRIGVRCAVIALIAVGGVVAAYYIQPG